MPGQTTQVRWGARDLEKLDSTRSPLSTEAVRTCIVRRPPRNLMFTKNPSTFCLLYLHDSPIDASTAVAQPLLSLKIFIPPNRTRYIGLLWICIKSPGAGTRDIRSNHEGETPVPRIAALLLSLGNHCRARAAAPDTSILNSTFRPFFLVRSRDTEPQVIPANLR